MPVKKCSGYESSKLPSPLSAPDLSQISRTAQSEPDSGASAFTCQERTYGLWNQLSKQTTLSHKYYYYPHLPIKQTRTEKAGVLH